MQIRWEAKMQIRLSQRSERLPCQSFSPGILLILVALGACLASAAPQGRSEFEVVSIKPNRGRPLLPTCTGDRFVQSMPVSFLVQWAYGLTAVRIHGLPDWAGDRDFSYRIEAKAGGPVDIAQCKVMIQALLASRFKMVSRREMREMHVLALTVGKRGSKMHEIKGAGDDSIATIQGQAFLSAPGTKPSGISMSRFASYLGGIPAVGAPVVDRTALEGIYSFGLSFSSADDDNLPPIQTALEEQLGLKLEPAREAIEVLVIEKIEKPETDQ